ncbi:proton-coupled amino acid transporter 1-like protein [Leptotrombidium deliense]|uniref:Proton-coupled amino acid transporter 1-like protein n=1 Tax=Leptotrombidium deliense TaxID=299467 RepID=A0A443SBX3_9ACAR|nr:proton-coupled amino acid transporter 1-like protein [Leptotrombidium deliense]
MTVEKFQQKQQKRAAEEEERDVSLMSNTATLMHLLKGNVGPAVLAIPSAVANAGLLVAEKAFLVGPKCLQNKAHIAKAIVNIFLLMTQIGFCCVYCIFIADNIRDFVKNVTHGDVILNVDTIMLAVYPIIVVLNFIRRLSHLAIASAAANILQVTGLAIIFYNLFIDLPPTWTRPATADITRLPLFFGTAIYAFEGIGLILPLQKDMKEPAAFIGFGGVLNTGMVIVGCFYFATGFFGFLKYGDDVKGSITLNLPCTPLYETVQLMLTIAVFPLYALQLYVPITIIWPFIQRKFNLQESSLITTAADLCMRAVLVTITFMLAAAVPKLDLIISLIGALCSSSLALIFPVIIEMCTLWQEDISKKRWAFIYIKNTLILLFGLTGFLTGTYVSISNIIHSL